MSHNFFSFVTDMAVVKEGHVDNDLTTMAINFDPDTAQEVDIKRAKVEFLKAGDLVSKAEPEEERTHQIAKGLEASLARGAQAGTMLSQRIAAAKAANDTDKATDLSTQLVAVIAQIKEIGGGPPADGTVSGKLFDARTTHARAERDLHEFQALHAGLATKVTTAESRLAELRSEIEHTKHDMESAKAREQLAEQAAGLKTSMDNHDVAYNVMKANLEKSKEAARAYDLNAAALKQTTSASTSADDIIARTLSGGVTASAANPEDELALLLGKAA